MPDKLTAPSCAPDNNPNKIGERNIPARLEPAAEQTAAATLPLAIEVKAIEDCTVDGRTQTNNTPDHSARGRACGAANHKPKPSNGNTTKVAEVIAACSRQCSAPATSAERESRAPCKKNSEATASDPSV